MEAYAAVLSWAIPGFVLLIIVEHIVAEWKGIHVNRPLDMISSLSSGMTNTLKEILGLSIVIISYGWMVDHLAILEIKSTIWIFILAFIGLDFAGYWSHRFNHVVNIFWNRHIVHHSSEEFNLSCALRQSISALVAIYFFLYIPMAIIGIPAKIVAILAPLHLFAQFWYHTRLIGRMGILEHIIVTPSHHRVHHAINPEYIDKNYGQIFIFWDKWFGSFQEEIPDVPPVYGVKKPVRTWNPILINYLHMWQLAKDAWRTRKWWDKLRLWFMPTGWRPNDVKDKYPVYTIENVYKMEKYDTPGSKLFITWAWVQLIITNLLMYYVLIRIADFQFFDILIYAVFLFVSIFSYTSLMDKNKLAVPAEFLKLCVGIFLLFRFEGWYQIDEFVNGLSILVGMYLIVSMLVTLYFSFYESDSSTKLQTNRF